MTLNELIKYCEENNISLDTQIAVRAKDDFFLTEYNISLDKPYFGNCNTGYKWFLDNVPLDENEDLDYEQIPNFLILDSGYD